MRGAGRAGLAVALAAGLLAAGAASADGAEVRFEEIASSAGLDFVHDTGAAGEMVMQETMGSGVGLIDHDGDGDVDIYLVNSSPMPGYEPDAPPRNALYRNDGGRRFVDVTDAAGVGDTGYGQGVVVGDYDNDGDEDLYVLNHGPNVLYRNEGNGRFTDVTAAAGVGDAHWSSSGAFFDADADGDLDLFVANYCDGSPENNKWCGRKGAEFRAYCTPQVYTAEPDTLYRNEGNGRFVDVTRSSGLIDTVGKGLGVVPFDFDGDGDVDLHVANDATPNQLWRNDGTGRFEEIGLLAGIAYSEDGRSEAGMGTDAGDADGDGRPDLLVCNLDYETNSLLRNLGAIFVHSAYPSGIGAPSLGMVGFGVNWFEADNDGDLDIFVANGHIIDNIKLYNDTLSYAQPNHLFLNRGDLRFEEVGAAAGVAAPNVARGSAVGDLDLDGRLDIVVSRNGGPAAVYMNRSTGVGHWLSVKPEGRQSNRAGFGARVLLVSAGTSQVREVHAASSYQSSSEARAHFGLGPATAVERLEVRWPSGRTETFPVPGVDRRLTVVEGTGRAGDAPEDDR